MRVELRRVATAGALLLFVGGVSPGRVVAQEVPPGAADLEVFVLQGCPHCAAAAVWLERLRAERPDLTITFRVVHRDPEAAEQLIALARARNITVVGVPAFLVGDRLIIGWQGAEATGRELLSLLPPPAGAPPERVPALRPRDEVRAPVVGTLSARRLGLPLFTIALGLLDGFNPCAMWALLLILAILVRLQDRRRMLAIGGTFVAVGGVLYFAFLAAWLELFLLVGFSRPLQLTLGGVALAVGLLNLKDVVLFRHGVSVGIPDAAKPGIYARIRRVLAAPTLPLALAAVALLSAVVNLVELLCTAGLPAVFTHVLSTYELSRPSYYGYLLLYVAAYVLDDSLMLALATVTLTRSRLQERAGRWLKLVSGIVMVALALILLLKPDWLARL